MASKATNILRKPENQRTALELKFLKSICTVLKDETDFNYRLIYALLHLSFPSCDISSLQAHTCLTKLLLC